MSEHLVARVTDRGFKHMPVVRTRDRGAIKVYESSAATEPSVWLAVDDGKGSEAHAHLTVEAARQVAEQLLHTIANHYQSQAEGSS